LTFEIKYQAVPVHVSEQVATKVSVQMFDTNLM
jgi:hypothetical protein